VGDDLIKKKKREGKKQNPFPVLTWAKPGMLWKVARTLALARGCNTAKLKGRPSFFRRGLNKPTLRPGGKRKLFGA